MVLSVVFQKDAVATPQVGVSIFLGQRRCLGQCPLVKVSEGAGEVVQRATENTNVVIVTKVSGQKGLSRLVLQVSAQVCLTKPAPQMSLFLIEKMRGELADSLSMEHLTGAARELIPWFSRSGNGYLFMLTKSDNVEGILDLEYNGHMVVAWSMNAPEVSRKLELGAPSFERRLAAAARVQKAGYPVRIRLDSIVPIPGWREQYAETIRRIFGCVPLGQSRSRRRREISVGDFSLRSK